MSLFCFLVGDSLEFLCIVHRFRNNSFNFTGLRFDTRFSRRLRKSSFSRGKRKKVEGQERDKNSQFRETVSNGSDRASYGI